MEPINVSGFVEPFDTWADMTHLIARGKLAESRARSHTSATHCPTSRRSRIATRRTGRDESRARAARTPSLPRTATSPTYGRTRCVPRTGLQVGTPGRPTERGSRTPGWLASAALRHAVLDGERRTRATATRSRFPGSLIYRISPLDRTYDNLTIAATGPMRLQRRVRRGGGDVGTAGGPRDCPDSRA